MITLFVNVILLATIITLFWPNYKFVSYIGDKLIFQRRIFLFKKLFTFQGEGVTWHDEDGNKVDDVLMHRIKGYVDYAEFHQLWVDNPPNS